jgi:Asp-tRNA(Asn)/Glu-tRNA(Gln) amidotransferase A subunit family amidase
MRFLPRRHSFDFRHDASRVTIGVAAVLLALAWPATRAIGQRPDSSASDSAPKRPAITEIHLRAALDLIGLRYTDAEIELLLRARGRSGNDFSGPRDRRNAYDALRAAPLPNSVSPALLFDPLPPAVPIPDRAPQFEALPDVQRPAALEEVAFWPVTRLAALLRTGQVTSEELTRMYLDRLRRFDPQLLAVVTLTDSLAIDQARRADRELGAGRDRGPLHGIPYGLKDLFAVPGYPTTWGAGPYQDQVLDETASVARKLEEAGAVLAAKLTLGALAMGDVWFGGRTRNPWDTEQGSSGSSAGPGSAVSAGLLPFAIGTETLGSIVSPSTRNGVTGLRPSFGRVSRGGAMALSWSMDKVGPMCRNAEDCSIVFDAIRGADAADPSSVDVPFPYDADTKLGDLTIGYVASAFERERQGADLDRAVLDVLRDLGAKLVPVELPEVSTRPLLLTLGAEAASAFDELTRSGRDSLLARQDPGAWPNSFRSSRFIPAVEYIQANRVRRLLQIEMRQAMEGIDAYVSPSFAGSNLAITNLTGHPCISLPNGFGENGSPTSITFCGRMYGEAEVLAVAKAYQDATEWDDRHPEAFGGK